MYRKNFRNADGIRGIACLIVLVIHSMFFFHSHTASALSGTAKYGVWLFFVLSAFLLTHHLVTDGLSRTGLWRYALSRMLRILPLYFLAILVYLLIGTTDLHNTRDAYLALTMQAGYAHLWTIPVEFKFYVLLPFIVALGVKFSSPARPWMSILIFAAVAGLSACTFPYWNTPENTTTLYWYVPAFMCGAIAALAYHQYPTHISDKMRLLFVLVLAATLFVAANPVRQHFLPDTDANWLKDKFVFIGALLSLFLYLVIDADGLTGKLLGNRLLSWIGHWSFPIYLFHWVILVKLSQWHPGSVFWQIIGCLGSIALGALLHYLIERPTMRLRQRVA
ncbi:MAG TPA: acyltransferase [Burkholderiaceae bacterium]|jgi:peptidoglycan/LPS O-acetylase OafA/YrhL|nr:acyltransferase [Burkholderiaceae bacterium]